MIQYDDSNSEVFLYSPEICSFIKWLIFYNSNPEADVWNIWNEVNVTEMKNTAEEANVISMTTCLCVCTWLAMREEAENVVCEMSIYITFYIYEKWLCLLKYFLYLSTNSYIQKIREEAEKLYFMLKLRNVAWNEEKERLNR